MMMMMMMMIVKMMMMMMMMTGRQDCRSRMRQEGYMGEAF